MPLSLSGHVCSISRQSRPYLTSSISTLIFNCLFYSLNLYGIFFGPSIERLLYCRDHTFMALATWNFTKIKKYLLLCDLCLVFSRNFKRSVNPKSIHCIHQDRKERMCLYYGTKRMVQCIPEHYNLTEPVLSTCILVSIYFFLFRKDFLVYKCILITIETR